MPNIATRKEAGNIPPEILGEIFVRCLPIHFTLQNIQQLLSSVCRLWRTVVLSTPALWASLQIRYGTDTLYPPLPVIRTYLQRSGAHPLSFEIHSADSTHFDSDFPPLLSVLTTLAAARQRWEDVTIECYRMTPDILDRIAQGDAPLLRSMKCFAWADRKLPIPFRMLEHCHRLESFQWNSPRWPILLPLVDTPLTSLHLQASISVSECLTLLRLSPRLSYAGFYDLDSPSPSTIHRLTHPTLCTFSIAGGYSNVLLDALTLPALLGLDLMARDRQLPFPEWGIALSALFKRSGSMLHKLELSMNQTLHEPTIMRILTLTPHLRSLTLSGPSDVNALTTMLIHALHPQSQPGAPLLPHLQYLSLSMVSDCPDGLWTTMLRARWGAQAQANGVACLEDVFIDFQGGVHDRDEVAMMELCVEGMVGVIGLGD